MTPQAWVEAALRQFATGGPGFATAHLDQLGLRRQDWPEAAGALSLAGEALPDGWNGRLSLALPLLETSSLTTSPPADAQSQADPHEPASLYLLSPGHLERNPTDGEEFHAAVPALQGIGDPRLRFEFVSSRDAHAAARQWGFVNTLWIHVIAEGGS